MKSHVLLQLLRTIAKAPGDAIPSAVEILKIRPLNRRHCVFSLMCVSSSYSIVLSKSSGRVPYSRHGLDGTPFRSDVLGGASREENFSIILRGGTYTTIDDPRAGRAINQGTIVTGVNVQGDVVGGYIDRSDGNHAFLLHAGAFTTLNPPGAVANARTGTIATSINAAGDIVGYYDDVGLLTHGFLLHQGTYTTLDDPLAGTLGPGTMGTTPYAIGDNGDIVGSYIDEKSVNHGFLLHAGVYTTFDHPRAGAEQYQGTTSFSFNVHGDVVGSYGDASGKWRGYLLHRGVYENFSEPNDVPSLSPSSIDDAGEIVGTFFSSGLHSFLYKPSAAN